MRNIYSVLLAAFVVSCTFTNAENVTADFCSKYDVKEYLSTYEEFGTDGVFDTMYQRIQFHFETIKKINDCQYQITGADRLKGVVTPFSGEIRIKKIIKNAGNLYDRETPSDDKMIDFYGEYELREDKRMNSSGVFKGDITFSLSLTKDNKLIDDMSEYMGDGFSNFTYHGTWTSYRSGQTKKCIWGQGRLPDTEDFDGGAGQVVPNEKYRKNGWELDDQLVPIDNPKDWWKN